VSAKRLLVVLPVRKRDEMAESTTTHRVPVCVCGVKSTRCRLLVTRRVPVRRFTRRVSRLQSDRAGTEGGGLLLVQTTVDAVQVSVSEPKSESNV
jgi:hypothetical protein